MVIRREIKRGGRNINIEKVSLSTLPIYPEYRILTSMTPVAVPERPRAPTEDSGIFSRPSQSDFYPKEDLCAVIPVANAEMTIGSLALLSREYAGTVIVVDDGSQDRTSEVARSAGAEVIRLDVTLGRTYALLIGVKAARERGFGAVVIIDQDHLTRDIPRLAVHALSGDADLVIGSEHARGRKEKLPHPGTEGVLHGAKGAIQQDVTDPGSMFRAISRRGLDHLDFSFEEADFGPAMIDHFLRFGLKVLEVPVSGRKGIPRRTPEGLPLYRDHKIGIVVPAYNEENLIGATLRSLPNFVSKVYVVNDASTDRTQEVIDHYAALDQSIVPIRHEKNQGVGAAIASGYRRGLEDGMDILAVMAGDNQMDPAVLPRFLDPIIDGKCDYAMGNRIINPAFRAGMSRWRFFGNAILTMLTKIASGYWQVVDPQNGYTAISRRALTQVNLMDLYPRYGYCNDILVKLNVFGFRVTNVPHASRYANEKSKIRYSTYIPRVSRLLLHNFLWRMKQKYVVMNFHPLVFFYFFGALLSLIGTGGFGYSLYYKFIQGNPIFVPLVVSLIVFGLGIQCVFFAMFFDMQQEKNGLGWY